MTQSLTLHEQYQESFKQDLWHRQTSLMNSETPQIPHLPIVPIATVHTYTKFPSWPDWFVDELLAEFFLVLLRRFQLLLHLLHLFVHFHWDLERGRGVGMCLTSTHTSYSWQEKLEEWPPSSSFVKYLLIKQLNADNWWLWKSSLTSFAKLTSFSSIFTFSALSTSPSPTCSSFSFSSISSLSRSSCRSSHAQDRALGCPT